MISVVIATNNDERTLGQCLAALVPAAIDGLVREVILADAGSTDDTLEIADDAGARLAPDLGAACKMARSDWLLIADVAVPAPSGWDEAVAAHINGGSGRAAWWGPRGLFGGKTVQGLLVPRRMYEAAAGQMDALASQAKRLKI